jgi:peptidoglycan/xylan/chitin deacetylase (PgdA/CDA1 family)
MISQVPTVAPMIGLTFDDGPDAEWTERFVDALGDARATFFVLGHKVRHRPDLLRMIVDRGHEVACHGDQHRKLTRRTPRGAKSDLRAAHEAITSTGITPRFFRPPHGLFTLTAWQEARRLGMQPALWSHSGGDWERTATPTSVSRRVLGAAAPGTVFLLHDSGGWPGRPATTLAALPSILEGLQSRGLTPVTLSELVRTV